MTGVPMHPRLVSLEGGEGAGKSTVIAALRAELEAGGDPVVCTREPGGTPLAESIRALLLDSGETPTAQAELLLMFAARAQHVHALIRPALERGAWVISDRFTDSSYAYQGGGRGLDRDWIAALERETVGLQPGLTLLLDLPLDAGRARLQGRGGRPDRIECEQDDFFLRAREAYSARAAAEPHRIRVLDAGLAQAAVAAEAVAALRTYRHAQEAG